MSSDFLSRPILDWDNIALLYAGVQKNAGPAGLTIAIIAREYYDREKKIPQASFVTVLMPKIRVCTIHHLVFKSICFY